VLETLALAVGVGVGATAMWGSFINGMKLALIATPMVASYLAIVPLPPTGWPSTVRSSLHEEVVARQRESGASGH
jgi:hypothetical protein